MDRVLFGVWFCAMLLPSISKGSIVVMDNARFRQKRALRKLAEACVRHILFLSPYSPDLNPIEHFWT
jgi:transposase